MMELSHFGSWLREDGPAALVRREILRPAAVDDDDPAVIFPPTYAFEDKRPIPYNVDSDVFGVKVALVDSVGSQANRMEPIFKSERYAGLVPRISSTVGKRKVDLLDLGHRAADAAIRFSLLQDELTLAFADFRDRGDATLLAKMAPTSLVFGAWDSRATEAKVPRIVSATIRAHDVAVLTRSAQYSPAVDYVDEGVLDEPKDKADQDLFSSVGLSAAPAAGTHGGIQVRGHIVRDATVSLVALRNLGEGDEAQSLKLRRYVLGLSLVAFTADAIGQLRSGCILVRDKRKPPATVTVGFDGGREPVTVSSEDALKYAKLVAADFVVGKNQDVTFDAERAKKALKEKGDAKEKKKKKGGKGKASEPTPTQG